MTTVMVPIGDTPVMAPGWWAAHSPHWNRTGVLVGGFLAVAAIVVSIVWSGSGNGDDRSATPALRTAAVKPPSCPTASPRKPTVGGLLAVDGAQGRTGTCWTPVLAPVNPGEVLHFLVSYQNLSEKVQTDVEFRVQLADGVEYVPNTTKFFADSSPNGEPLASNAVTRNGITLGNYTSGAGSYITFDVAVPLAPALQCGMNDLRSEVFVQPKGVNFFKNTIETEVNRTC